MRQDRSFPTQEQELSDEEITFAIERLDFKVTGIDGDIEIQTQFESEVV